MRVGFVQTRPVFGRKAQNVAAALAQARKVKADLLVFPELFNTGYVFGTRARALELAEPLARSHTVASLIDFSSKTGTYVVAGLAEREDQRTGDRLRDPSGGRSATLRAKGRGRRAADDATVSPRVYNTAVLVGPYGMVGAYRKVHLFRQEKDWFDAGDTPFTVYDIGSARVGLMICFDWLFPEAARTLALAGADIICHPANLVLPYCQDAMITRSIENRVFTITANRIGTEKRGGTQTTFTGKSQVTDTSGRRLLAAPSNREYAAVVEIDPRAARDKQITPQNSVFSDRRPSTYDLRNREPFR